MHHLTILGAVHPDAMALLDKRPDVEVTVVAEALAPREEIMAAVKNANGIAVRTAKIDAELLESVPGLKIVSRHGVGCDSVDVDWMSKRGLPVAITVGGNDQSVAEHTMAMMLGLARDTPLQQAVVEGGDWTRRNTIKTRDLSESTLLIVGCGRIGSRVAGLARAFGMRVIAHDPYINDFPEGVEPVRTLEAGLAEADYVTLHCPKNAETEHLINADALAAMKPGAILLNCARGGIAEEAAVAEALHSGHLGGYGCDVFSTEPAPLDNPVIGAPRTMLSAHTAAMSPLSMRGMGVLAVQNVLDCFDGCLKPEMIFNRKELGL